MRRVHGALVPLALLAACGGEGPPITPGDAATGQDAASDAASCNVAVQFMPAQPTAPVTVVAQADVLGGTGVFDYEWTVRRGATEIPVVELDVMGRDVQFDAMLPGVYTVTTNVLGCSVVVNELNVGQTGANVRPVRMHFVPPAGVAVPPQERVVSVPGGADYSLGTVVLDPGVVTPVAVRTAGGAPLAAYLRFTSRTTPDASVEAWSGPAGSAQVRLAAGHHDVLVVPSGDLAPALVSDWDPASGQLVVPAGSSWTGTVLDSGGGPIAGTRVSLTSGGVPSTVSTTDAAGRFDVKWNDAAGAEDVVVVPPAARGLPRLDLTVAAPVSSTIIRFADVPPRALGGAQVQLGGAPAADAEVSIALTVATAATIEAPAAAPVTVPGGQRLLLHTGADGRLPATTAIAGSGAVFVSTGGGSGRAALDLSGGVGPVLAVSPAITVNGRAIDGAGVAVAGARVRATLDDELAYAGAPVITAIADATGGFALALAPGQRYAVTVTDPTARRASVRATVERTQPGALPMFTMGKALRVSGEVRATGIGAPLRAVGVAALCQTGCLGLDRDRPLGEAVTDAAGRFVVAVPDPGVGTP